MSQIQIKMKIKPIEIEIKSYKELGEVAVLLDRKKLLEDLCKARLTLSIKQLIPYEEVEAWLLVQEGFRQVSSIEDTRPKTPDVGEEKKTKYAQTMQSDSFKPTLLTLVVDKLKAKHGLSDRYDDILIYSIIAGKVADKELENLNRLGIFQSMMQRLNHAFDPPAKPLFIPDTAENLERDRKWYWQKKSGLSYHRIWDQATNKGFTGTEGAVIQAIRRYQKKL